MRGSLTGRGVASNGQDASGRFVEPLRFGLRYARSSERCDVSFLGVKVCSWLDRPGGVVDPTSRGQDLGLIQERVTADA